MPPVDPQLADIDSDKWAKIAPLRGDETGGSVTIIVPVYGGRERTLACLHSVLAAQNEAAASRLLVIDDCSPEPQLTSDLQRLAARNNFDLIRHPENRGFVSTVNEGILGSRGDVILLNADTVVFDHWLDHLHAAAQMRQDLGSVSPLTNNGTILSYPFINAVNRLPLDCSIQKICAFLEEQSNGDPLIEIPTRGRVLHVYA